MPNTDFDEFVRRQQAEKAAAASIDWDNERDTWLRFLNELYAKIEAFLEAYLSAGRAEIEYREIQLNEPNIGAYPARLMVLKIGAQAILFTPKGTLLVASKGRVDVQGPVRTSRLVLINKKATNARSLIHIEIKPSVVGASKSPSIPPPVSTPSEPIEWVWKIVSRPPELKFTDLTRDTFFEMILEVANA